MFVNYRPNQTSSTRMEKPWTRLMPWTGWLDSRWENWLNVFSAAVAAPWTERRGRRFSTWPRVTTTLHSARLKHLSITSPKSCLRMSSSNDVYIRAQIPVYPCACTVKVSYDDVVPSFSLTICNQFILIGDASVINLGFVRFTCVRDILTGKWGNFVGQNIVRYARNCSHQVGHRWLYAFQWKRYTINLLFALNMSLCFLCLIIHGQDHPRSSLTWCWNHWSMSWNSWVKAYDCYKSRNLAFILHICGCSMMAYGIFRMECSGKFNVSRIW